MSKIGFAVSKNDVDTPLEVPLAEHFGKAKWLLVVESDDRIELVRNNGLNGKWVADAFAEAGCTDIIASHLGPGAFHHLAEHKLTVWRGAPGLPVRALIERFRANRLEKMDRPEHTGSGESGGCCS